MIGYFGGQHGSDLEHVPESRRSPGPKAGTAAEPVSDEALMAAYLEGDTSAFRELFQRYAPRVRALHSVRQGIDSSDLVQQTFLRLHRARGSYRAGAPFRPWLMTIAQNLAREAWRRSQRAAADAVHGHEFAGRPAVSADVAAELRRAIEAVAALPELEREVVTLHCGSGLSVAETASRIGVTESAVKARAHRGYRRLRAAAGAR
jgi:RNA polymerase sigma-70 factor (ECF subfamily)